MATQIGQSLQVTREAGNQQAKATTAARQVLLEEAQQWRVLFRIRLMKTYLGGSLESRRILSWLP
jgi:hypothetical protein